MRIEGSIRWMACLALSASLCLVGCEKERPLGGKLPSGDSGGSVTQTAPEPAVAPYKVVAHRGGASECGSPDNSRASLRYAQNLKCYASECDIYWTKDNNVIIAHADGNCMINGVHPWEATLDEIRSRGRLSNQEIIPSLDDFLDIVVVEGKCTKLWLDIKNITSPSTLTEYPIKAVQRSCEIIKERGAEKWCEFICTGNATVGKAAASCMYAYGIPVGWMANYGPATFKSYNYSWGNLNARSAMKPYGTHSVSEFVDAGLEISVFNVDQKSGDGNAVYESADVAMYLKEYPKMKAICTNYPSWLIKELNNNL